LSGNAVTQMDVLLESLHEVAELLTKDDNELQTLKDVFLLSLKNIKACRQQDI
jgi:hypothetical protein